MKPYLSESEYAEYTRLLKTNNTGLLQFDKYIYPKMFGYKDTQDYYEKVSIVGNIAKIKVPVFGLSSKDDQLIDDRTLPRKELQSKNSRLCIAVSEFGMHACHMTGTILPWNWYYVPCMEFLQFLETRNGLRKETN